MSTWAIMQDKATSTQARRTRLIELADQIMRGELRSIDCCTELWVLMTEEFGDAAIEPFCLDQLYSEAVLCPDDHAPGEVEKEYRNDVLAACRFIVAHREQWRSEA